MTESSTPAHWLVTVTGADRPGIIAAIASVMAEEQVDVEDISMTCLTGSFAMILLARGGDESRLRRRLADAAALLGMAVHFEPAPAAVPDMEATHFISAAGPNRVGIVATLSRVLADHGANITEMSTRLLDRTRVPVYLVRIACRVEAGWDALEAALADAATGLGVELRAEPLESTDL